MILKTDEGEGTTPLDPDETQGLIPTHITTLEELNEWEQVNIVRGKRWTFLRLRSDILSPAFVKELHRRMFDETWDWAGQYRTTDKNIGIAWRDVPVAVHDLCDDVSCWLDKHVYKVDEAAARFHHRLTHIRPFPNGNGRHARLMTDTLLRSREHSRFTWGRGDLRSGTVRQEYIAALHSADGHDFNPLFRFLGVQR